MYSRTGNASRRTLPVSADWYERSDELMPDQVFRDHNGEIVKLDRRVPGDGTDWYVLDWDSGWFAYDRRIHPGDLAVLLPSEPPRTKS